MEPASITFADGNQITCDSPAEKYRAFPLREARLATAPLFAFGGCVDSEGGIYCEPLDRRKERSTPNTNTTGREREPGGWLGQPEFISGKKGSSPAVGMVYTAEEKRGRMFGQITCEGEAVHAFVIGGENKKEQLTAEIKPVNTMASEYTATLTQKAGVQSPETLEGHPTKPLEALVNGQHWETVGIEATQRYTEVDVELPNHRPPFEVELKATP